MRRPRARPNDLEQATEIARKMVCEWGMSDILGPIAYGQKEEPIFLGKEIARHKDYSEETARAIDNEIKKIVETSLSEALRILTEQKDKLKLLATRFSCGRTWTTTRSVRSWGSRPARGRLRPTACPRRPRPPVSNKTREARNRYSK